MAFKVDYWKLYEYREELIKKKELLKSKLEAVSNSFIKLDWDDNVMDAMQEVLNKHIATMNTLLGTLKQSIAEIDDFLNYLKKYLDSVDNL